MVESADSGQEGGVPSLAEDVQLVLAVGGGELQNGWAELSAAALVELTLLGRIGSEKETGFFARKEVRKLFVLDARPTGDSTLDCALAPLVARGKSWEAYSCVKRIGTGVAREAHDALIRRGAIQVKGKPHGLNTSLWVADEKQYKAAVYRLDTAWLHPEDVADPRMGAFVDLLRNASERFSRGAQHEAVIRWEWYPPEVRDTVYAILDAERIATSPSSGTGYEG